jgi:hypothetical protein
LCFVLEKNADERLMNILRSSTRMKIAGRAILIPEEKLLARPG